MKPFPRSYHHTEEPESYSTYKENTFTFTKTTDRIMKNRRAFNNTTALKALEEIDEGYAIEVISNENLDGSELSEILTTSLMGHIKDKNTGEPMKLSNKVLMSGILNRLNQIDKQSNK